jgi:hypothetical protein
MPEDLDEALVWLSDTLRDPERRGRLAGSPQQAAAFIEKAALVMSEFAQRDGQDVLSQLLVEAAVEAGEQSKTFRRAGKIVR